MKKCTIICNKESGRGINSKNVDLICTTLKNHGYTVKVHTTKNESDAISYVKTMPYTDLVLSIGGDGTFNQVVTGNFQRKDKLLLSHDDSVFQGFCDKPQIKEPRWSYMFEHILPRLDNEITNKILKENPLTMLCGIEN